MIIGAANANAMYAKATTNDFMATSFGGFVQVDGARSRRLIERERSRYENTPKPHIYTATNACYETLLKVASIVTQQQQACGPVA